MRVVVRVRVPRAPRLYKDLTRAAGWSFVAAVIARGANLIALVLCARILAQEQFGRVAIIQTTVGVFGPIAALGLSMTATKFLAELRDTDRVRAGRILALSLGLAMIAGLVMTGALILAAPTLAAKGLGSRGLEDQLVEASPLIVLGVIESVQTGALTGLEAFSEIARLGALTGLLSIPIIALLADNFGASGAIAGLTISLAISCWMNGLALRNECRKRGIRLVFSDCTTERRLLLGFSLPSYLSGILVVSVSWLTNVLLVKQSGGFSEVALFTAADRYRYLLIFVPLSVSRIAIPALSRFRSAGDHDSYRQAFWWNVGFGLLATVPSALLVMLLAAPLMGIFGESFTGGWPVLAILAASAIPTVLNTQLGTALVSGDRVWARTATDAALAAIFLAVGWWAVPRWNAAGLAAAFAIAYSSASAILVLFLRSKRFAHARI